MRFNPPPNWPVPPGWTPGPNWAPDPSWGPPPPGWQFWVDDSAARTEVISLPPSGGWTPANYYPPPSFPGSSPGFQPPPRKSRAPLVLACVAVVVVIAAVVTIVLTVGSKSEKSAATSSSSSSSSPRSTTTVTTTTQSDQDQIGAVIHGMQRDWNQSNYSAFANHYCSKEQAKLSKDSFDQERSQKGQVQITFSAVSVSGTTATVSPTLKFEKESQSRHPNWKFVKEGGEWKFC